MLHFLHIAFSVGNINNVGKLDYVPVSFLQASPNAQSCVSHLLQYHSLAAGIPGNRGKCHSYSGNAFLPFKERHSNTDGPNRFLNAFRSTICAVIRTSHAMQSRSSGDMAYREGPPIYLGHHKECPGIRCGTLELCIIGFCNILRKVPCVRQELRSGKVVQFENHH